MFKQTKSEQSDELIFIVNPYQQHSVDVKYLYRLSFEMINDTYKHNSFDLWGYETLKLIL